MAFKEIFDQRNIENANRAEFNGWTGIIILLCDKNIYIINAGSSRCLVLDKEGKIINKAKDHILNAPDEKRGLNWPEASMKMKKRKRVKMSLKLNFWIDKGFENWEFKGYKWIDQKDQEISVEPNIIEVPSKDAQYSIMGSHGMLEGDIEDNGNDDILICINLLIRFFYCLLLQY